MNIKTIGGVLAALAISALPFGGLIAQTHAATSDNGNGGSVSQSMFTNRFFDNNELFLPPAHPFFFNRFFDDNDFFDNGSFFNHDFFVQPFNRFFDNDDFFHGNRLFNSGHIFNNGHDHGTNMNNGHGHDMNMNHGQGSDGHSYSNH